MDALYKRMCSEENLKLAFTHLKSSQNIHYKNYYRSLMTSYEINLDKNIKNLSERLKGDIIYKPSNILRFYMPKPSGLHRPISLLHLDDLIVYQALTIIVARRFKKQRGKVENTVVFSNVLNRGNNSIFFLERWKGVYNKFTQRIKVYYTDGYIWVGHFDLAAFYDTISHDSLTEQISKSSSENFEKLLKKCLKQWSTSENKKLGHGIPQGPISSNFLAEVFLLPVNEEMMENDVNYIRYVDDIKIFGKTKKEVLENTALLEKKCREKGLMPQSHKHSIIKSESLEDAIGKTPSLTSSKKEKITKKDKKEDYNNFVKAFNKKTFNISTIKYILKASGRNDKIFEYILSRIEKTKYILRTSGRDDKIPEDTISRITTHPELADEFCQFLSNYTRLPKIGEMIFDKFLKTSTMDPYSEGKYWELLSHSKIEEDYRSSIIKTASDRLKRTTHDYSLRYGIYILLCSLDHAPLLGRLKNEKYPLTQAFVTMYLSKSCINDEKGLKELIGEYIQRSSYEPLFELINRLHSHLFEHSSDSLSFDRPFDKDKEQLIEKYKKYIENQIAKNRLKNMEEYKINVIRNALNIEASTDIISELFKEVFEINTNFKKWDKLITDKEGINRVNNYLKTIKAVFHNDRNVWVNYIDNLNELLIHYYYWLLTGSYSRKKYSNLLKDEKLEKEPFIKVFKELNSRRNKTPSSHAMGIKRNDNTKSLAKVLTENVTSLEQRELYKKIGEAYKSFVEKTSKLLEGKGKYIRSK